MAGLSMPGPFRSYGKLLIINAGDGYHVLLAGMDQINVQLGQFVLAGEPVAMMASPKLASAGAVDIVSTQPVLYIEFRKDGTSIDPAPWWAATMTKRLADDTQSLTSSRRCRIRRACRRFADPDAVLLR